MLTFGRLRTRPGDRSGRRRAVCVVASLCALIALAPGAAAGAGVELDGLRTEQAVDPLGVERQTPQLSWRLRSTARGLRQTAYEIVVASRADLLSPAAADVWHSGRVESGDVRAAYGGPALAAARRYHWAVRVWTRTGDGAETASPWSAPARWDMGLLSSADWRGASWIGPGDALGGGDWSDYSVESDVRVERGAAGIVFRAQGPNDFYMWQLNIAGPSVLLRPHVQRDGAWRRLSEVVLDDVIPPPQARASHRVRIDVRGETIETRIDGQLVDTRTDPTFARGGIGFRSGDPSEIATYDDLVVRDADGEELFADDFENDDDPAFPQAQIADGRLRTADGELQLMRGAGPPAPLLRKRFTLDPGKQVAAARLFAYGLGWYELRLSGARVDDRVLAPAATDFAHRSLYQSYDVTDALRPGENTLGIELAEGYGAGFSRWGWRWTGPRQAIVRLQVEYADGSTQDVVSDGSWRWADGPVLAASIYGGETYDARLRRDGWDTPAYDASDWAPVQVVAAPSPRLRTDTTPPIRVVETLDPVAVTEPEPGVYVFDLGQNIAGWARLRTAGPAGSTVTLRHAENLHPDGSIDTFTNRNAAATDRYVLAGTGAPETYEPRFTYHGFRYVEVRGLASPPTSGTLVGRAVHADVRSTASFESSDELLDRIYANNRWTILNNALSYPTDTPVRDERTPPGMDVHAYVDAAVRDFDMARLLGKYLDDIGGQSSGPPDMDGAHVAIAWALYEQYGDPAQLERAYPGLAAYVDSLEQAAPDGVWPEPSGPDPDPDVGFGDWCAPLPADTVAGGLGSPLLGGYEACFSEVSVVNTALAFRLAQIASRAAQELGRADDAARYAALAERIRDAFEQRLLNADGNGYGSGRQVTSVLPLAFGIVPPQRAAAVGAELVRTVLEDDDGHLDTGIFGTRYLVDALVEAGRPDVALRVLRQTTYPSFGFQQSLGATTAWEAWTYRSSMQTHDHAMFTGINASFLERFAGIEPLLPGYAAVRVAPVVPDGLERVSATVDTVRGPVRSAWRVEQDVLRLEVDVPPNATAEVRVPVAAADEVRESGVPAAESPGVRLVRVESDAAVYAVGSGAYAFVAGPRAPEPREPGPRAPEPREPEPREPRPRGPEPREPESSEPGAGARGPGDPGGEVVPPPSGGRAPAAASVLSRRVGARVRGARASLTVRLACPRAAGLACRGRIALRAAPSRRGGDRRVRGAVLGRARYAVPAGRSRRVRVRLTRTARVLLRERGRVTARVTLVPAGGRPAAVTTLRIRR